MDILHFWRKSNKMAEIKVPAWPMPTHQTKLVMSHAHPTVLFNPHTPIPSHSTTHTQKNPPRKRSNKKQKPHHQTGKGRASTCLQISSETLAVDFPPVINVSLMAEVACISNYFLYFFFS